MLLSWAEPTSDGKLEKKDTVSKIRIYEEKMVCLGLCCVIE